MDNWMSAISQLRIINIELKNKSKKWDRKHKKWYIHLRNDPMPVMMP